MKLSIYTTVKNGIYLDYHVAAMLKHHLPLADEIVVNEGFSTDGTLEAISNIDPKIKIFQTDWGKPDGQQWLVRFKEAAKQRCTGDWCILLDCDEFIPEWEFDVIRDVLVRETVIGRVESGSKNKVWIRLGDGHAGVFDFLRQPALRGGNAVLHVDSGDVQVVTGAEGYIDAAGAIVRTSRGNVMHALDAVDLLLERRGYSRLDYAGIRAHIVAGYSDLRGRERRIKRNGQRGNGNRACQNNQQRADRRKNWPSNKKIYQRNFLRRGFTAEQLLLESCLVS